MAKTKKRVVKKKPAAARAKPVRRAKPRKAVKRRKAVGKRSRPAPPRSAAVVSGATPIAVPGAWPFPMISKP